MKSLSQKINEALAENTVIVESLTAKMLKTGSTYLVKQGSTEAYAEFVKTEGDKHIFDNSGETIEVKDKDLAKNVMNESVNESISELCVFLTSKADHQKVANWLVRSDFHADENPNYFSFPVSGQRDADETEKLLDKEFAKLGVDARYESNESMNEAANDRLLKAAHLSSSEYQKAKKLTGFDSAKWVWNSDTDLYDAVTLNENSSINESVESNGLINSIKTLAEKLEVFHHNTHKFSNHIAFDRIQDEFGEMRDELIEKLIGYTGDRYESTTIPTIVYTDRTGAELVSDIRSLGEALIAYAESTGYQDIGNMGQSVHGLSARLNYLLTLNENVNESVNEAKINSEKEFQEYAETVMKKAHGDKYDQKIVDKIVKDILKDTDNDYAEAIGRLTSGLGEDLEALPTATSNQDGVAFRTEDLHMKSDSFKEGYACKEDMDAKCPYEEGTDECADWMEGHSVK